MSTSSMGAFGLPFFVFIFLSSCRGGPLWPPLVTQGLILQRGAATEDRPYMLAIQLSRSQLHVHVLFVSDRSEIWQDFTPNMLMNAAPLPAPLLEIVSA